VCTNKKSSGKRCCANTGGDAYFAYLKDKMMDLGLHGPGKIRISQSGCLGRCGSGPCMVVYPEAVWYTYTSFADLDEIIDAHFVNGAIAERNLM